MAMTKEEILALGVPDPSYTTALDEYPKPQYDFTSQATLIKSLRDSLDAWDTGAERGISERDIYAPARDKYQIRVRIYTPEDKYTPPPAAGRPMVIFYHGGGMIMGSPESVAPICRFVARTFNAVCASPAYRLAPEYTFPTGANDAWDCFLHLSSSFSSLNASPSAGFIVGGVSVGGKLASVVSHLARDEEISPPLTGLWFAASSFIMDPSLLSTKHPNQIPLFLSRTQPECLGGTTGTDPRLLDLMRNSSRQDPTSPLASPLIWPTGHAGLPRTYFQVCGMDVVRDNALVYDNILKEEDGAVETKMDMYKGWPHIFFQNMAGVERTRDWYRDAKGGLRWLLRRDQ